MIPDPNFVLVGGGAEIEGAGQPGALLTGSSPIGPQKWCARSKDHIVSYPHRLRAYLIGLQLDGVSATSLQDQTVIVDVTSPDFAAHPMATAQLPNGYVLTGGGAQVSYFGAGQLLTQSMGTEGGQWVAASKDHDISDPGLVDAYAIGVAKCPTGYVGGCLTGTVKTEQKSFTSSSSYDSSAAFVPSGFALTGGGGYSWLESEDDGPGRLLVKLIPDVSGDFVAWNKDHVDATTTGMAAQAIGIAKMPTIPVPSGYNNYCSTTDGVGWGLGTGPDPCASLGPLIARAGLYNQNGNNTVIVTCSVDGFLGKYRGFGDAPLTQAFNDANSSHVNKGCTFTVAPEDLPVFRAPIKLVTLPAGFQFGTQGYDFAMAPGGAPGRFTPLPVGLAYSFNFDECSGLNCGTIVNYKGQIQVVTNPPQNPPLSVAIDNHGGLDWVMNAGEPLYAVADGQVIAKRSRAVPGLFGPVQNELYIKHVVGTSKYAEIFLAVYAHLRFAFSGIEVGSMVRSGQIIGYAGNFGSTSGGVDHLHFGVIRLSNTTTEYRPGFDATPGKFGGGGYADNTVSGIDPYGWKKPCCSNLNVDPAGWVWRNTVIPNFGPTGTGSNRTGGGALSINLWKPYDGNGTTPPPNTWAPPRPCDDRTDNSWNLSGGGFTANPYATCQ